MPEACVACSKDNHRHCLRQVLDVASSNMVPCPCCGEKKPRVGDWDEDQLRAQQTYGGERRGCGDD